MIISLGHTHWMHSQPARGTSMKTGSTSSSSTVVVVDDTVVVVEEVVEDMSVDVDVERDDEVGFLTAVIGACVSGSVPMQPHTKTIAMTAKIHFRHIDYGFGWQVYIQYHRIHCL